MAASTDRPQDRVEEINGAFTIVPQNTETPLLISQLREGLGTKDMTLDEMLLEMRTIRDASAYVTQEPSI